MELRGEEQLGDALSPILHLNAASVIYSMNHGSFLPLLRSPVVSHSFSHFTPTPALFLLSLRTCLAPSISVHIDNLGTYNG